MQFDRRFLIYCQNTRIDFNELFHETFTKIGEVLVAQKKVRTWFCFYTARAEWIYSVLKILFLKIYVL